LKRAQLPAERRHEILAQIHSQPLLRVTDLAQQLGVSAETIRRDLITLEREGLTRRVYGGATTLPGQMHEAPYEERSLARAAEKRAMARVAAGLVKPGEMIILDIGTSVAEIARALPTDHRGIVLTCSLLAAAALAGHPRIDILVAGGRLRRGDLALSGHQTEAFFADFFGGTAFLGSGGVHPLLGLTDYHPDEVAIRRVMIDHSERRYVMADSTKLGQLAPAKVCDLERITGVITDDRVSDILAKEFERAGVPLLVAEVPRADE
jgi:DeoR family transcriptional regulator, fructose operon transcriptional repressor